MRPGYPKLISDVWGIEGPIDAAFTRINCQGKTYLFKVGRSLAAGPGVLPGQPAQPPTQPVPSLSPSMRTVAARYPQTPASADSPSQTRAWRDAAASPLTPTLSHPPPHQGSQYWRFDDGALDPGYPRNISEGFEGIPNDVDAAFALPAHNYHGNERVYFFKGKGCSPPLLGRAWHPQPWAGHPSRARVAPLMPCASSPRQVLLVLRLRPTAHAGRLREVLPLHRVQALRLPEPRQLGGHLPAPLRQQDQYGPGQPGARGRRVPTQPPPMGWEGRRHPGSGERCLGVWDKLSCWAGAQATCRNAPGHSCISPSIPNATSACAAVPSSSPILARHSVTAGDSLFPLELEVP